ncbi:MAG: polysaccharide biosynthesis/export family protein [Fibrobacterota bacterium]
MKTTGLFFFVFLLLAHICYGEVEDYVLQSGDVIAIQVVEHPEFSGQHKIRPDGRINYPVIGEIEVASLTPAQLVKIMQGKLSSYVNNPVVSVSIEAYYSNKIFIIGDVRGTGEYEIYEPVDVLKALAMCGGLRKGGNKQLKIIRADGSVVDIAMDKSFWSGKTKQQYVLYPGDTLYVPESFQIPWSVFSTVLGILNTSLSIVLAINILANR